MLSTAPEPGDTAMTQLATRNASQTCRSTTYSRSFNTAIDKEIQPARFVRMAFDAREFGSRPSASLM